MGSTGIRRTIRSISRRRFFIIRTNCGRKSRMRGFSFEKMVAVEGPVWVMGSFGKHWDDPAKRALLLEFLRTVEEERAMLGRVGAHDRSWEEVTRRTGRNGKSDGQSTTSISAEGPGPSSILADALKMTGFLFSGHADRCAESRATSTREEHSANAKSHRRCCSGRCRRGGGRLSLRRRGVR